MMWCPYCRTYHYHLHHHCHVHCHICHPVVVVPQPIVCVRPRPKRRPPLSADTRHAIKALAGQRG